MSQSPFSIKNKAYRVLWNMCWLFLFRPTPVFLHVWRIFLLRMFGADIHWSSHVYPSSNIWFPRNLILGKHSCLGPDTCLYTMDKITIGDYVVVSQHVYLCTGSHDHSSFTFKLVTQPITIANNVWLCARTFVAPGTTILEGTVIGANSFVKGTLKPWTIYAGSPAVSKKPRILRNP